MLYLPIILIGIFVRTMKMTTKEEVSLTSMYSAATEQLTKTNSSASKRTKDVGASAGAFGIGASAAHSTGFSSASSSGSTQINTNGVGVGSENTNTNANFQSTVTCFGEFHVYFSSFSIFDILVIFSEFTVFLTIHIPRSECCDPGYDVQAGMICKTKTSLFFNLLLLLRKALTTDCFLLSFVLS